MLVNQPGLSSHADECCAMLAGFNPEEAHHLRRTLAARHGDGTELLLTVGAVVGTEDETMLTDVNKEDTACRKVITSDSIEMAACWYCMCSTVGDALSTSGYVRQ